MIDTNTFYTYIVHMYTVYTYYYIRDAGWLPVPGYAIPIVL